MLWRFFLLISLTTRSTGDLSMFWRGTSMSNIRRCLNPTSGHRLKEPNGLSHVDFLLRYLLNMPSVDEVIRKGTEEEWTEEGWCWLKVRLLLCLGEMSFSSLRTTGLLKEREGSSKLLVRMKISAPSSPPHKFHSNSLSKRPLGSQTKGPKNHLVMNPFSSWIWQPF